MREDLGALATAARLEGRTDVARRALEAQRRRFPSTAAGHEAAFFLGRIAEDTEGDTRAAVGFHDSLLTEAPGGALAQEALGRKLAALGRMQGAAPCPGAHDRAALPRALPARTAGRAGTPARRRMRMTPRRAA